MAMSADSPLPIDLEALPPAARQVIADLQTQAAVLEQTLHAQFAKAVQAQEARIAQLTELAAAQEAQVAQLTKLAAAQEAMIAELKHLTDRQEYLIAELRHARFGKKSEKLSEDERQLAFEDLEVAVAETQEAIDQQPTPEGKPRRKAARHNRGNLPAHLPRIEQFFEPTNSCRGHTLQSQAEKHRGGQPPLTHKRRSTGPARSRSISIRVVARLTLPWQ
jgi:hypothetical protein